jgi:hypothetical protein
MDANPRNNRKERSRMRLPRLTRPIVAVALAVAAAGVAGAGVGVAASTSPPAFKACATNSHVLTLANSKGRCAKGSHSVHLNATGPAGPRGAAGPAGAPGSTGPKGESGAPGGPVNSAAFDATFAAESASFTAYTDLVTLDGVTVQSACYDNHATGQQSVIRILSSTAYNAVAWGSIGTTASRTAIYQTSTTDTGGTGMGTAQFSVVYASGPFASSGGATILLTAPGKLSLTVVASLSSGATTPACEATGTITEAQSVHPTSG